MIPSIIVPAYYSDQWLPGCIDSLARASTQRLHLILLDNYGNSLIDTLDLKAFEHEILRCPYPMGFAEANNHALLHASHIGDCVLFLNQDIRSTPGWLDACMTSMETNPDIAALSPLVYDYDLQDLEPWFLECANRSESFARAMCHGAAVTGFHATPVVPAAALLVRSSVLLQAGPFDPVYGSYYEDYDLCRRLRQLGAELGICGDARVGHYSGSASSSPEAALKRDLHVLRNRVIYEARYGSRGRSTCLLHHFLLEAPRQLLRTLLRRPGAKPLRAVIGAYTSLLRLLPRLVSRRRDREEWLAYLASIRWSDLVTRMQQT